jgi:Domain of unknown function (DUF4276)
VRIRYALTGEGPSDQLLLPVIEWTIQQHAAVAYEGLWADPGVFADRRKDVATRITQTKTYYPSDLIFVHRDVDGDDPEVRRAEFEDGAGGAIDDSVVPVIPVRMTEAWFLFDETAIRLAAGNPSGRVNLNLPRAAEAARLADPKSRLESALLEASETTGRRRDGFRSDLGQKKFLVARHISSYAELRIHASFQRFEQDLLRVLDAKGWAT